MNAPDRVEILNLPIDEPRVVMVEDEKINDAATFTLKREDHTLGNMLRTQLLSDSRVLFAGYLHPHPLDHDIIVKVQSKGVMPAEALRSAAAALQDKVADLQQDLKIEGPAFRSQS